jgi:hypothetical protein
MRKTRTLVITPFDAKGKRVLDTVRRALVDIGIEVLHFDNIAPGASWANAVMDAVRSCDFLVVDITRKNPNVFYELGLAHALRKPTVLITSAEDTSSLPSDLAGFQYIVYDPSNFRDLINHIQRAAKPFLANERASSDE